MLLGALLALELALRWAGKGYPTQFFLPASIAGKNVWTENLRFGWRFFPKQIARTPQPIAIAQTKESETFRVFVLGESAALGDPKPAFGMPRILEILLQDALPGQRVEVVNAAMTAINSHVIREIADECASRQGDVWVVYAGNNEVIGPYGGGTVFGKQVPARPLIAANLAWRATRIGQLCESWSTQIVPVQEETTAWTGLEMFKDHQLTWSDPRLRKVYQHFEANLDHVVRRGMAAGARVVLATVACNLKDCAPFGSVLPSGLPKDQALAWDTQFRQGLAAEEKSDPVTALSRYQEAAQMEPAHAELQFRIARLLLLQGKSAEAKTHFTLARDHDVQRFRADSSENEIIRRVAKNNTRPEFGFVDAEQILAEASPQGIPGAELFLEHVHFRFEGNYALARALAPEVLKGIKKSSSGSETKSLLSQSECAARLGYTDWDRVQAGREIQGRMQALPFTAQLDHAAQLERVKQELDALKPSLDPSALKRLAGQVGDAIQKRPSDWVLRDQQGKLFQAAGDFAMAVEAWKQCARLMPHFVNAPYQIGNLLDSSGKSREAEPFFRTALETMPHFVEAMNGLGLCLAAQQRHEEAAEWYAKALEWRPGFATAHVNWGLSLAAEQRYSDALKHYEAALKLRPNNANAHYNIAVAMKALQRTNDVILHLQQVVALNPQFREARYNLASELARQGKLEAAVAEYRETINRWPQLVDAYYGLASTLVQLHQLDRAAEAARTALRLNPNHAAAKALLQQLGVTGPPIGQ